MSSDKHWFYRMESSKILRLSYFKIIIMGKDMPFYKISESSRNDTMNQNTLFPTLQSKSGSRMVLNTKFKKNKTYFVK